jgi:hypothetical protein
MPHLESGVVWGTVLLVAGAVLVLDALGLEIVSEAFWAWSCWLLVLGLAKGRPIVPALVARVLHSSGLSDGARGYLTEASCPKPSFQNAQNWNPSKL